jgi:hypothetical protein
MQKIKEQLLATGAFLDNEAFSNYCQLIVSNRDTKSVKGKTQKHHILPRAWFKLHNKPIDNSKDNLVNLLVVDHVKAHLYLLKATSSEDLRNASAAAVRYMCDIFKFDELDAHTAELEEVHLRVSIAKAKKLAKQRASGLNERRRAVVCIETGQEFKTIKDAQDTMRLWIKQHLKGLAENAGGYHFKYIEGETPEYKPKVARFTKEELKLLRERYPSVGQYIPELLTRHSAETIRCKALELKLTKNK